MRHRLTPLTTRWYIPELLISLLFLGISVGCPLDVFGIILHLLERRRNVYFTFCSILCGGVWIRLMLWRDYRGITNVLKEPTPLIQKKYVEHEVYKMLKC